MSAQTSMHERNPYVSMQDIAKEVGMHVSTVSLALNDSPKIKAKTKARIREVADALGYRSNPYLSALMKSRKKGRIPQKSPVIAYITSHNTKDGWRKVPISVNFYNGCCNFAATRGYEVKVFWLKDPNLTPHRFSQILFHRGIQGIIFAPCIEPDAHIEMDWDLFSPVTIGYSVHSPQLHRVSNNHFLSMIQIMDYCHRTNIKRVGFAIQKIHTLRLQHRWLGAYLAKRIEYGMDSDIEPLITEKWTPKTLLAWYDRFRPEVIVGPFGSTLYQWLSDAGIKVPEQVELISVACPEQGHLISGIFENTQSIGERAVEMVISMIEHTQKGIPITPTTLTVAGTWNPGKTVKNPQILADCHPV